MLIGLYVVLILAVSYLFLWYGKLQWDWENRLSALFFWVVGVCVLVAGLAVLWMI